MPILSYSERCDSEPDISGFIREDSAFMLAPSRRQISSLGRGIIAV
jgi:hypothetical protein